MRDTVAFWRKGVRFYIALAILLVTLETWWWASVSYSGSILFATRMEEAYAWYATVLLGAAVSIGPLYAVFPKLPAKRLLQDARRLLGVGAAWFATLHASIAYFALFKHVNPLALPKVYQQSFAVGSVALVILLAMAFTSFDRAFNAMGIWWFRLHRLVYIAAALLLLHAYIIGVHATHRLPLLVASAATLIIFGMYVYLFVFKKREPTKLRMITLSLLFVLFAVILNYGYRHQR